MIMTPENFHRFTLRPKLLRGLRVGLLCIPVLAQAQAQAQEHFNATGSGATSHSSADSGLSTCQSEGSV